MLKTFQYRLYPTKAQETKLKAALSECRWLYNHFLAERKTAWEERQVTLGLYEQLGTLPAPKAARPSLAAVHSQVLQNVGVRIDLAFKAFFRRVKAALEPGYPRCRGQERYDSFCYPQVPSGCRLCGDRLMLSGIGTVRVRLHRPSAGKPKTACIRRSATGKWYVTFACEWEPSPLPQTAERVGIDVGLHAFAAFSTGEPPIENPRFFRQEEHALAKAQRKLAKAAKGTPKRRHRRQVVARVHERTRWKRQDFAHEHSRRIVDRFQVIAVEDLSVNRMVQNHRLAKSISDAAWAAFAAMLSFKAGYPLAGEAGRSFIAVNPANTSQDCSRCGHRQNMPLSDRTYQCSCCGLELDRDRNAALNILRLGLLAMGLHGAGLALGSPLLRRGEQSQWEVPVCGLA